MWFHTLQLAYVYFIVFVIEPTHCKLFCNFTYNFDETLGQVGETKTLSSLEKDLTTLCNLLEIRWKPIIRAEPGTKSPYGVILRCKPKRIFESIRWDGWWHKCNKEKVTRDETKDRKTRGGMEAILLAR